METTNPRYIEELISIANVIELTRATILKVGLEFFPAIPEARLDEIISQSVNAAARS